MVYFPAMKENRAASARPDALWRLVAAFIFTLIPAISLPMFLTHLYQVRPHVTDAAGGFVQPRYHDGVTWYFAHADEVILKGLFFWLLSGVLLLMFLGGMMLRRRVKIWLRPPRDVARVSTDGDDETSKPV